MTPRELSSLRKGRELQGAYLLQQSLADQALAARDKEIRRLLDDFSNAELAAAFGLSRERVRQIANAAP